MTLGNTPQKIHPPDFDKDTSDLGSENSHLSIPCFPNTNTNTTTYYCNHLRTITQTIPSSSHHHPHPRPSTTTNHFLLSSLFGPCRWNKYFHIPAHASYSENTFQFKKCIQRPERYRLVIVNSESQAPAMLTLKDLDGKSFLVSPDTKLRKTHTHAGRQAGRQARPPTHARAHTHTHTHTHTAPRSPEDVSGKSTVMTKFSLVWLSCTSVLFQTLLTFYIQNGTTIDTGSMHSSSTC